MNFKEMLLSGKPLPELEYYDMHAHIDTIPGTSSAYSSCDSLVCIMKKIGIKKSVISSGIAITTDFISGNDRVMEAVEKYPDELSGYVTVNPNYSDGTDTEIKRCRKKGMVGIKIHPVYISMGVCDPRMEPCFEYADANGSIVLVHTFSLSDVAEMEKIVKKYPNGRFILAHSGASGGYMLTAEIIRKYENAYCDICVSMPRANMLEHLVSSGDDSKILYGTDTPISDQRITLSRILLSDISDASKVKILSENYLKLFDGAAL